MKYNLIILLIMMSFACRSQGDVVRSRVNKTCQNLQIPEMAKATNQDYILHKDKYYVLFDRYANLAVHSGRLADCGINLVCAVKTTEWERDCKDETNTLWYNITGSRPACSIPAPEC
jgi:hypothetical protein